MKPTRMGCSRAQSIRDGPENPTARDGSPSAGAGPGSRIHVAHPTALPSAYRDPRGEQRVFRGSLGRGVVWGWGWEGDGDVWSELLPPAVTHSALIAP